MGAKRPPLFNYNYMNRDKYISYLKSDKWKSIKRMMLIIKDNKCENCKSETALEIHHKTYKRLYKEKYKDLQVLCKICHKKTHGIS